MTEPVNHDGRRARAVATEAQLLASAGELFLREGYAGTTLSAVAEQAGVSPRTVYVRFGTKAALLQRVVGVALAGDLAPAEVHERDWYQRALTAATAAERIAALTTGSAAMVTRAAPMIEVAAQAALTEPAIAESIRAARAATRESLSRFWRTMRADRLLPPGADIAWLTDTTALLAHVETYLLARAMLGMTSNLYPQWLRTTFIHLAFGEPAP